MPTLPGAAHAPAMYCSGASCASARLTHAAAPASTPRGAATRAAVHAPTSTAPCSAPAPASQLSLHDRATGAGHALYDSRSAMLPAGLIPVRLGALGRAGPAAAAQLHSLLAPAHRALSARTECCATALMPSAPLAPPLTDASRDLDLDLDPVPTDSWSRIWPTTCIALPSTSPGPSSSAGDPDAPAGLIAAHADPQPPAAAHRVAPLAAAPGGPAVHGGGLAAGMGSTGRSRPWSRPCPGRPAAAIRSAAAADIPLAGCSGATLSPASSSSPSATLAAVGSSLPGRHRPLSTVARASRSPQPSSDSRSAASGAGKAAGTPGKKQQGKGAPAQAQQQQQPAGKSQGQEQGGAAPAPSSAVRYTPLHYNIEDFCSKVVLSEGEKRQRMEVIEAVRAGVRRVWPNVRSVELQVFGSFANGLSTWSSDLDLVVTGVMAPDRMTGGYEMGDRAKITARLRKIADAMNRNRDIEILRQQLIPRARIPILKLWTKGRVCVDVSMSDDSGPRAARYMAQQCRAFPPLKPLVLVLKTYLKACGLNEVNSGGLSSYSLTNMVIAHLQEELKAGNDISDLGETLYTFLLRYGEEHDYGNKAVSVASGGIVSKMSLGFAMESARQAAASMASYDGAVSWNERLCVDCPLTGRDVSNGTYRIDLVRDAFVQAARKLEALVRGRRISDTSLNYLQALFDVNRVLKRSYDPYQQYEDAYLKVIGRRGVPGEDEMEGEELQLTPADSASDGEGLGDVDDLDGDYLERQPATGAQQRR